MKKTLWITSIYLFLSAMPVGADDVDGATHSEAGIANEPSGVFVNFVTSASGATPTTAINASTAGTAEVTSTTSTSQIGASVQALSLDLSISPPQAQAMISLIDALPTAQIPESVAILRAQLAAKLAEG